MTPAELLLDAFGRIVEGGRAVVDGLETEELTHRVGPDANSIAWLVWHLTRIQDDHVAEVAGLEQVWTAQGFEGRFRFPFNADATGYGHSREESTRVRASASLLAAYLTAVHEQTVGFVKTLTEEDLDRVVDEGWDPPVTLGVRLVSVTADGLQHLGQAKFVRGLLAR